MKVPALPLALLVTEVVACQDLSRFRLREDETYCGQMVSAPVFHEGMLPAGIPPTLSMRLELDVNALSTRPGTLTTDDADRGLCAADGKPLFLQAPLRGINELLHDPLSNLEFGDGREQNILAWVDSSCQATMLAVLSLMKDESVEVRLLKPAADPPPDAGPELRPGFGMFRLQRRPLANCPF